MRLISDSVAAAWLEDFIADPENFDWDDGNRGKNAKHAVTDEEIESILSREKYVFVGKIVEPPHDEWRGLILGENPNGRPLALVFTRRGEKIRPISCRPMRTREWRFYETIIENHS